MLSGAQRAKPASSPKRMIIITTAALEARPRRPASEGFTGARPAIASAGKDSRTPDKL
jgi:hypothetical protein